MFLGAGLMIHFRSQDGSINYIIVCAKSLSLSPAVRWSLVNMAGSSSASDREGITYDAFSRRLVQ